MFFRRLIEAIERVGQQQSVGCDCCWGLRLVVLALDRMVAVYSWEGVLVMVCEREMVESKSEVFFFFFFLFEILDGESRDEQIE